MVTGFTLSKAKFIAGLTLALLQFSQAAQIYVSASAAQNGSGSESSPFATLQQAQNAASPGDTVWIKAGNYIFSGTSEAVGVLFNKSGTEGQPIRYWAAQEQKPVFDFFNLLPQERITGFQVRADYLHFKGLELKGVQQTLTNTNESWCIHIQGSNNIFENLDLHHNEGPGIFIKAGSDNLVLNVDSHHNFDADRGGENADGFGCHTTGNGNLFRGCRAWWNSDDGFDFINSPGVCTVEHSWAFYNGFQPDSRTAAGNGAGIKAGGFTTTTIPETIPRHVVRFNLSFENRTQGFYANHHEGGIDWINNTAINNPRNYDLLADEGRAEHFLRNNIAHGSGGALNRETPGEIDDNFNSWNGISLSDDDFESLNTEGMDGPRGIDGSLPNIPFMKLSSESSAIDAGEDRGLPYSGDAPDLGAFEFESPTPILNSSNDLPHLHGNMPQYDALGRAKNNIQIPKKLIWLK